MNKLIPFIALIICQSWTLVWAASYQIQLKNGNEINTSRYWEEGDEIKFYAYGGVAGIQKGVVSRVTTSNVPYKEDSSSKEDLEKSRSPSVLSGPKSKESSEVQIGERESQSSRKAEEGGAVDFDYYRERKVILKGKLENALQKNEDAKVRQDQEDIALTRKEYLEFSKQINDLGDEIKRKNRGVLPDWWQE